MIINLNNGTNNGGLTVATGAFSRKSTSDNILGPLDYAAQFSLNNRFLGEATKYNLIDKFNAASLRQISSTIQVEDDYLLSESAAQVIYSGRTTGEYSNRDLFVKFGFDGLAAEYKFSVSFLKIESNEAFPASPLFVDFESIVIDKGNGFEIHTIQVPKSKLPGITKNINYLMLFRRDYADDDSASAKIYFIEISENLG